MIASPDIIPAFFVGLLIGAVIYHLCVGREVEVIQVLRDCPLTPRRDCRDVNECEGTHERER